jgi:hypothetical protein
MVVFLVYLLLVRVERIDPTSVQAQFVTLSSCVMYLHTYIYKLISLIKRCDLMNLAQSLYVVSLFQKFSHRTSTEKCSLGPALGQLPTYFVRATHLISKLVVIHNYIHADQSFEYLQYELMNININEVLYPKCVSWSSWLEIRRSYQSHNR